jgi:ArsR family transcriptional regulator
MEERNGWQEAAGTKMKTVEGENAMKEFVNVMKALSDPHRVKLIKMLQRGTMCVCEVQAVLEISQPMVSKHLKILEKVGLVSRRKQGLWVYYSLTDGARSPYVASLLGNLVHWFADDPELRALLEKSEIIRKKNLCGVLVPSGRKPLACAVNPK